MGTELISEFLLKGWNGSLHYRPDKTIYFARQID